MSDSYIAQEHLWNNPPLPENVIHTLQLYKQGGLFVFDKPEWNTVAEVFVPSATAYLEMLTDKDRVTLIFSTIPFPNSHKVEFSTENSDQYGSYYYSEEFDHLLWLCPYLFRYFPSAPENIYLQVI